MTYGRLIKAIAFLALTAIAIRVSADSDTWWHLAAGRWMAANGRLLQEDVFSFTRAGQPWVNPGWLAQLAWFAAYRILGHPGVNLLTGALAIGAYWVLWPRLQAPGLLKAFVVLLSASAAAIFWAARPHMFSFLLAAVYLAILEDWRAGRSNRLWLLPLLMVPWVNLHGGFAIGFLLIGAYAAGAALQAALTTAGSWPLRVRTGWESASRLLGIGALTAAAVSLNPQGPRLLAYPFQTVSIGALQDYIQEWQSPDFHAAQAQPFAWLLLITPVALALSRRARHATELLLYLGFGYLSLAAARNIATFALAVIPALSRHAADSLQRLPARPVSRPLPPRLVSAINWVLLLVVGLGTVVWVAPRLTPGFNQGAIEARLPVRAVDWLASQSLPGPLLHSYQWGGYVIWHLWPEYATYVDGRTDLFGQGLLAEYLSVWRAEQGWQATVEQREFRLALLEPGAPIALALQAEGWQLVYQDELALVLRAPASAGTGAAAP